MLKCIVQPFGHFCPFQLFFFIILPVIVSCINFGTGVYFYWNFTISPPFPLINLFCTRYKIIVPLSTFWTKMSPLKLLFLIAVPFNCKMMQFLLIGFHSVGKASNIFFFTILRPVAGIKFEMSTFSG